MNKLNLNMRLLKDKRLLKGWENMNFCSHCDTPLLQEGKVQLAVGKVTAEWGKKEEEYLEAVDDARQDGYKLGKAECQERMKQLLKDDADRCGGYMDALRRECQQGIERMVKEITGYFETRGYRDIEEMHWWQAIKKQALKGE